MAISNGDLYGQPLNARELANELWEVNRRFVDTLAALEVQATREEQLLREHSLAEDDS